MLYYIASLFISVIAQSNHTVKCEKIALKTDKFSSSRSHFLHFKDKRGTILDDIPPLSGIEKLESLTTSNFPTPEIHPLVVRSCLFQSKQH